jgi:hypothetical protein
MTTTPVRTLHDPELAVPMAAEHGIALPSSHDVFNSSATAAPHPEEMKLSVDLSFGQKVSIKASIRTTPAGLVSVALLVSSVLIPVVWLAHGRSVRGRQIG